MISITSTALTHPGRVRKSNEDNMVVTERLAAVADGLGGHAAGEVASKIAVDRLRELGEIADLHPDHIIDAIADTNRLILAAVREHPDNAGMGTTITGVAAVSLDGVEHAAVFNVGDSRTYRLVEGDFAQVSVDHSEVQELQDSGQITAEAAVNYPRRNIITRCLGTDPAPQPDIWVFVPSELERFVLCSDGLSGEVTDDAIAATAREHADAETAAESLLQQALDGGGRDNVTVIVVDLTNDDPVLVDEHGVDEHGVDEHGVDEQGLAGPGVAEQGVAGASSPPSS
ncbi:PP2C family protein-serine/threonine phosphatase [uncultured Jatrophihabitans sp.]|uniref:PP2C family protein-serine/threonine phosphatase n=1 Tax=uncultured Jatrophihabitans sp. TaxID=1610747 RepID=UPI0035CA29ED